jgi:uncharacterized membrane protein YqjE
MKIVNIETKEERESLLFQLILVVLSIIVMALSVLIILEVISGGEIKLIGTLIALSIFIIAMIIWAIKKGFIAEEIVTAIENEKEE